MTFSLSLYYSQCLPHPSSTLHTLHTHTRPCIFYCPTSYLSPFFWTFALLHTLLPLLLLMWWQHRERKSLFSQKGKYSGYLLEEEALLSFLSEKHCLIVLYTHSLSSIL